MLETEIGSCAITNWTKNYWTQLQASLMHPPAEFIQMISIMEPSLIETISVTTCSKRAHQSKKTILVSKARTIWVDSPERAPTQLVGSNRLSSFVVAVFLSFFTAAHFSVVAALVPPAQQKARRSRPFTYEASKTPRRLVQSQGGRQKSSRAGCSAS